MGELLLCNIIVQVSNVLEGFLWFLFLSTIFPSSCYIICMYLFLVKRPAEEFEFSCFVKGSAFSALKC